MTSCEFESCGRPKYANGLCGSHRAMQRKGILLRPLSNSWASRSEPPEVRFWAKVDKSPNPKGCWLWAASIYPNGYGVFAVSHSAHRYSYELHNGSIPEGMVVDHICRVRHCVNPDHLRACTQKQNGENREGIGKVRGVSWVARTQKWRGAVTHHGKYHHVGYFTVLEDAERAVIKLRNKLFTHNDTDK